MSGTTNLEQSSKIMGKRVHACMLTKIEFKIATTVQICSSVALSFHESVTVRDLL